jgi:S1-C subfamily serine protease
VADPYGDFVDGGLVSPELAGARLGDLLRDTGRGRLLAIAVGTVERDSPAWLAGLREGDVVLEVNRERVRNLQELGLVLSQSRFLMSMRVQRDERIVLLSRR